MNINLTDVGVYAVFVTDQLEHNDRLTLEKNGYDLEYDHIYVELTDEETIQEISTFPAYYDYDEMELTDTLRSIFSPFPGDYFLLYSDNITWDNCSGYKIVSAANITDIVNDGTQHDLYLDTDQIKNNVFPCRYYSHDVPTGTTLNIIRIPEQEYNRIYNMFEYGTFHNVRNYVNKRMEDK